MAIPSIICRGKNLHLATMKQFLAALPKKAMPKADFLDYAEKRMTGFRQTHSQIARQMALYYCDSNNICHPRFAQELTLDQILSYSRFWAERYFVPNPYTPSFPSACQPTNIYGYVIANSATHGGDLDAILFSMFNQKLNEVDKAKSYLLQFTGIIEGADDKLVCDHLLPVEVAVKINRYDEVSYYHYFDVESPLSLQDYGDAFVDWFVNVEKKAKKTAENYLTYFASLNKEPTNPINNHSTWPGIFPYLFNGAKSKKEVRQIGTCAEFNEIFGQFCRIFDGSGCPNGATKSAYQDCVKWVQEVADCACLSSAFKAYRKFLEWREEYQARRNEEQPPANVDRLDVALKIFAEKRYEEEWQGKTSSEEHQSIYSMSDLTLEQLTAGSLDDFYNDFLLKVWVFKNGGSRKYAQLDDAEKMSYRQFVVDLKTQLRGFDAYFPPNTKCPAGMGVGMLTELMMRFWPKSCCSYNKLLIHDALMTLGMAEGDFVWPKTPSIYQDFMGKCATILRKMEHMKLPRRPEPGNDEPPDYITVNEFLWFVHDYKDLIKEKVMSKKMKTDVPTKYDEGKRKTLAFDPNSKDDELLLRLLAALRAKPFAILAGHSGTGKSRYVKKLAYMTCNMDELRNENQLPGNYLLLQVKPNWHDSTELLGFRNALDGNRYQKTKLIEFLFRAYQFKDTPFFLCLDEMNLAPVEQYFAEFLSSMESSEPVPLNDITVEDDNLFDLGCEWKAAYDYLAVNGFSIPKNLFIVGTVNMDETTNQFSRKVLDRAFTIEMTDVDFKNYGHVTPPSYADTIEEEKIQALLNGEKFVDKLDAEDVAENAPLVKVQKALEPTAFAVAYRFANEYTLLKRAIACFDKDSTMKLDALDQAVLMKILPRVAGEKDYIEKVYGKNENEGLRKALEGKSVSLKKIAEIMKRANDMNAQYITFWP